MSTATEGAGLTRAELEGRPLADLHVIARAAGVDGFRKLRREELIEKLEGAEAPADMPEAAPARAAAPAAETDAGKPPEDDEERPRRRSRGGRRRRERSPGDESSSAQEGSEERKEERDDEPQEVLSGILDVLPQGHGLLRQGLTPAEDDIYISPSQIRRCDLRPGDEVEGPVRQPRRGERHRALVRVEKVGGAEPGEDREAGFDALTPVPPHRLMPLQPSDDDVLVRSASLVAPLAYGQRVLVRAEPRSGRTTLLRGLVKAITAADDAPKVIVLLVDEGPEEVTEWSRQAPDAEIAAAPADLTPADQVRHAELALGLAKRRAEAGDDVVFVIDSLTRLGVAHGDPAAIKPVFGAGRELEEEGSGSLTVIATVLAGTEDGDEALEAVETTENATIALDPDLAKAGITPALDVTASGVSNEEKLRSDEELEEVRSFRRELLKLPSEEAATRLAQRFRS